MDARERRHGPAPWRGSVSPFSWTNAALSASHDGSGDAFLSGGPWGPFRCPGTLTKNVSSGGSSAHGLINRSDSVWLTTEEVHEGPQSIAFPVPPLKRGSVRLESCNGGTVMGPEGPAGPPTLCSSWREKRRLPFQTLFQKTPASLKSKQKQRNGISRESGRSRCAPQKGRPSGGPLVFSSIPRDCQRFLLPFIWLLVLC